MPNISIEVKNKLDDTVVDYFILPMRNEFNDVTEQAVQRWIGAISQTEYETIFSMPKSLKVLGEMTIKINQDPNSTQACFFSDRGFIKNLTTNVSYVNFFTAFKPAELTRGKFSDNLITKFGAFEVTSFSKESITIALYSTLASDLAVAQGATYAGSPNCLIACLLMYTANSITDPEPDDFNFQRVPIAFTFNARFDALNFDPPGKPPPARGVYRSAALTSETFFMPKLSSSFAYNFFEIGEESFDNYKDRSYKNKKISEVPKYIKLNWDKAPESVYEFLIFNPQALAASGNPSLALGLGPGQLTNRPSPLPLGIPTVNPPRIGSAQAMALLGNNSLAIPPNLQPTISNRGAINPNGAVNIPNRPTAQNAAGQQVGRRTRNNGTGAVRINGLMLTPPSQPFLQTAIRNAAGVQSAPSLRMNLSELSNGVIERLLTPPNQAAAALRQDLGLAIGNQAVSDVLRAAETSSGYVGYILEKERLNTFGDYEQIDRIIIENVKITEYIDAKIAYGETYRYRVRSIFQYVNKNKIIPFVESDEAAKDTEVQSVIKTQALVPVYYYDSFPSSYEEETVIDTVRPDPPDNMRLFPNSKTKQIFVLWSQKAQNRDIIGYDIFRKRLGADEFYEKLNIGFIPIRNNFFVDKNIEPGTEYVYAVNSTDRHGNTSALSSQYVASINDFNPEIGRSENDIKLHEFEGLELNQQADQEEQIQKIIRFNNTLELEVNPIFVNSENLNYIIRITSLDTLQEKEVKLNLNTLIINH